MHIQPTLSGGSPYTTILKPLQQLLETQNANTSSPVIRLIIPQLLSPLLHPPSASEPAHFISFLHTLRALSRQHSTRLVIIVSWPLSLYPRTHILTRYAEHLLDGLLTLHPFPHSFSVDTAEEGSNKDDSEKTQGLIRVLKLPILTERGLSVGSGEDMAFAVSRRRFVVRPFHLPPLLEAENNKDDAGGPGVGEEKEGAAKIDAKKLEF